MTKKHGIQSIAHLGGQQFFRAAPLPGRVIRCFPEKRGRGKNFRAKPRL